MDERIPTAQEMISWTKEQTEDYFSKKLKELLAEYKKLKQESEQRYSSLKQESEQRYSSLKKEYNDLIASWDKQLKLEEKQQKSKGKT